MNFLTKKEKEILTEEVGIQINEHPFFHGETDHVIQNIIRRLINWK